MEIKIEDYKGQEIFYNDDWDKFTCAISIEDKWKETKRSSLKDVRKEIDTFIKLNAEFKPFKMLSKDNWGDIEVMDVTGIRSDGKFLVKQSDSYTSQNTSDDLMKKYGQYDQKIESEFNEIRKDFNKASGVFETKKKELLKKIKPLDLSMYSHLSTK